MLCTFCNTARLANEAPCPQCGAPSPLLGGVNGAYGAPVAPPMVPVWGEPPPPFSNAQANNWGQYAWPETAQVPPTASPVWGGPPPPSSNAQTDIWGQPIPTNTAQIPPQGQPQEQQTSRLLIPYQPQQALQAVPPSTGENAQLPVPVHSMADLVAALPEDAGAIYVAPMYTKPRPVIPRYRVVSGLLSVLIVTILLCAGAGYYAKASGKLTALGQFYGLVPPPNVQPAAPKPLPVPAITLQTGPAYGIINSATTTSGLNSQHVARQPDIVFKPGQTIWLVYSVQQPKTTGTVVVKWYANGLFYQASTTLIKSASTVTISQEYAQPAEGMVMLYWNNLLAIKLFFVVR